MEDLSHYDNAVICLTRALSHLLVDPNSSEQLNAAYGFVFSAIQSIPITFSSSEPDCAIEPDDFGHRLLDLNVELANCLATIVEALPPEVRTRLP